MDKKMAEKWVNMNTHFIKGSVSFDRATETYLAGFKAGRLKWHKVADGDLPKECSQVLCYCKSTGFKFYCIGHVIIVDNKSTWWSNRGSEKLKVIAWCEMPKYTEE